MTNPETIKIYNKHIKELEAIEEKALTLMKKINGVKE